MHVLTWCVCVHVRACVYVCACVPTRILAKQVQSILFNTLYLYELGLSDLYSIISTRNLY